MKNILIPEGYSSSRSSASSAGDSTTDSCCFSSTPRSRSSFSPPKLGTGVLLSKSSPLSVVPVDATAACSLAGSWRESAMMNLGVLTVLFSENIKCQGQGGWKRVASRVTTRGWLESLLFPNQVPSSWSPCPFYIYMPALAQASFLGYGTANESLHYRKVKFLSKRTWGSAKPSSFVVHGPPFTSVHPPLEVHSVSCT